MYLLYNFYIMWESRRYENLPEWLKKVSNPDKFTITKPFTKYFKGKYYVYKVLYERDNNGKIRVRYWRKKRKNSSKSHKPNNSKNRTLIWAIGILFCIFVIIIFFGPVIGLSGNTLTSDSSTETTDNPTESLVGYLSSIGNSIDPTTNFEDNPKTINYPYYNNGRKFLSFTTFSGLSDYFKDESHYYYHDFEDEIVMELLRNDYQDEYLSSFIDQIKHTSSSKDMQARNTISLVQHIPYDMTRYYSDESDWFYPYETLYNNQGVCCDKSILLAYLLEKLGYDVVLFEFSDHMAVGIKCESGYDFANSGFAFIETTTPTVITYEPDEYIGGFQLTNNPNIIHVSDGGLSLDVSQEYADAQELKQLNAMGSVLDQSHYNRWQTISTKYDMLYDTW